MSAPTPRNAKRPVKKPLRRTVTVFLDDEPIDALEQARADLDEQQTTADAVYDRRVALLRTAHLPVVELLDGEARLATERDDTLAPYRKAVTDAEEAVRKASQTYVFASIGRHAYEALIADHPATDADHEHAQTQTRDQTARARWHADTFAPALLSAACVEPGITVEEATDMYREWTDVEFGELFGAALAVNEGRRVVDLGKSRG